MKTYFYPSALQLKCVKCMGTYKKSNKPYKFSKDFTWSIDWAKNHNDMPRRKKKIDN